VLISRGKISVLSWPWDHSKHRWEQMLFYILSPVPLNKMVNVAVVLKGTLELPVECVYRGIHADALPYMACKRKVDSVGGEIMKSRHSIGRQNR
jgi:hypothetical protein